MEQTEILSRVDKEKLRTWLSTLVIPWIVKPDYFLQMGFPEVLVRRYVKKHRNATKLNGEKVKGVRGVSETDFLYGLANAIGADTSEADQEKTVWNAMRLRAKACLKVLDDIATCD
jgi:hypothetical protein